MKFLVRLTILGIALYIMLSLGLFEIFIALLISIGKVVINIASINPIAAAIGILILVLMGGSNMVKSDNRSYYKKNKASGRKKY